MQCVADFIGNSFVVQRQLLLFASCLTHQIKSYALRHRKAFRRKHFSNIIHHHLHRHLNHNKSIDSITKWNRHSVNHFTQMHSIVDLNNAPPHNVHFVFILFIAFIALIVKQLILHLRCTSQDYFRNSPLRVS